MASFRKDSVNQALGFIFSNDIITANGESFSQPFGVEGLGTIEAESFSLDFWCFAYDSGCFEISLQESDSFATDYTDIPDSKLLIPDLVNYPVVCDGPSIFAAVSIGLGVRSSKAFMRLKIIASDIGAGSGATLISTAKVGLPKLSVDSLVKANFNL